MNTKFFLTILAMALPVALSGCWNASRSYNEFMAQGQQRNVPLMIYNTSWNGRGLTSVYKTKSLAVGLINTDQSTIDSVSLYVAACPLNTNTSKTQQVSLTGPFLPGRSYVTQYVPSASSVLPGTGGVPPPYQRPLVIQAIGVTYVGGTEVMYRNSVARLLTPNIANYCPIDNPLHH